MRIAFILLVLALAAALGWFFLSTEPSVSMPLNSTVSAHEATPEEADVAPLDLVAPTVEVVSVSDRTQETVAGPAPVAAPGIQWNELELLGQLVSLSGQPLSSYTVLVAPSGLKPAKAGSIPLAQRCITDERGYCDFAGLSEPGPWDVYAFPTDLGVARDSLDRNARVGTATAKNPGDAERVTFSVRTGAVAILRSPLPEGLVASDIWIEAVPSSSVDDHIRSIDPKLAPPEPKRSVHRFAQGAYADNGAEGPEANQSYVRAILPKARVISSNKGYGLYVRTLDGLFGLVTTREDSLSHATQILIDEPLEPRGRVVIQLDIQDVRQEPMLDTDWQRAIAAVDWQLLLDDPARSSPDLPRSLRTTSRNHTWVRTGKSTFELTDLPLGVPLEIGDIGSGTPSLGDPTLGLEVPPPAPREFLPVNLIQATPVHGDAEPVEVRIRRVR